MRLKPHHVLEVFEAQRFAVRRILHINELYESVAAIGVIGHVTPDLRPSPAQAFGWLGSQFVKLATAFAVVAVGPSLTRYLRTLWRGARLP